MENSYQNISIKKILEESISVKTLFLHNEENINKIEKIVEVCVRAFKGGNKLLLCGNGGSASDAQHIAAELSGKFYLEREPLNAEALHVNSSFVTAIGNDYSFDEIYRRGVLAKGQEGDILMAISTSGSSKNIINAVIAAHQLKMITISMTGSTDNPLSKMSNYNIKIPSTDTPRIQECHITVGHIICELIEKELFA